MVIVTCLEGPFLCIKAHMTTPVITLDEGMKNLLFFLYTLKKTNIVVTH